VASALNLTGPWILGSSPLSQQVAITTRAIVTISSDSAARTDTLHAALAAAYVWASRAHRRVDGRLSEYRVGVGGGPLSPLAGLQLPRPFTAEATGAGSLPVFVLPAPTTACTEPALSAAQGLYDAWIPLPDTLSVGRAWTDTVQTLSCRDRVPLRGTSIRRFRVVRAEREDGTSIAVYIERANRGRVAGEGDQFGEHVVVEGETSGTVQYAVDPASGQLLRATGNTLVRFSLKSRRRIQQVRQESELSIRWNP
jgi:hypothetical protein